MPLQRLTALMLLLLVPAGGIWMVLACDGESNDSDNDSASADYCTIICHAQGHYCPINDRQQDHCTCSMSKSLPDAMTAGPVMPAVIQNPIQLDVTIEWGPASFSRIATPASSILESPTPPPKISA
jgi:hypothetical protein